MTEAVEAAAFFADFAARRIPWVVDDGAVRDVACAHGFETVDIDDWDFAAPRHAIAFFVPTCFATQDALHDAWDETPGIMVHYSLVRYDEPVAALDALLAVDFDAVLKRRRALYAAIDEATRVEVGTAAGRLVCHFGDEIEAGNAGSTLESGGSYSICEYFEAAMVNMSSATSSFRAEGIVAFDALGWLCNSDALRDATADLRGVWLERAAHDKNTATFDGGRLVRIELGGADVTAELVALCSGKERETAANELGFGCRTDLRPWDGRNALLHKSRCGIYIGLGAGHQIPHIDLIATGADTQWVGPSSNGSGGSR